MKNFSIAYQNFLNKHATDGTSNTTIRENKTKEYAENLREYYKCKNKCTTRKTVIPYCNTHAEFMQWQKAQNTLME